MNLAEISMLDFNHPEGAYSQMNNMLAIWNQRSHMFSPFCLMITNTEGRRRNPLVIFKLSYAPIKSPDDHPFIGHLPVCTVI